MGQADWTALIEALDRRAAAGRPARFWLRDDDAVAPTPALDRLLALARSRRVPVTLAVIPHETGPALAERLATEPGVTVALHGWDHANHAPAGQKSQELGPHRPAEVVLSDLARGFEKLQALHGARFLPLLVPPWNRIDPALLPQLPDLGLSALSVFGPERPGPLATHNVHVDPIDWHGSRSLLPEAQVLEQLLTRLASGTETVGVMTHHLAHDGPIWSFLAKLLKLTGSHPGCDWCSFAEVAGWTADQSSMT